MTVFFKALSSKPEKHCGFTRSRVYQSLLAYGTAVCAQPDFYRPSRVFPNVFGKNPVARFYRKLTLSVKPWQITAAFCTKQI
jgi:hypothetical protein